MRVSKTPGPIMGEYAERGRRDGASAPQDSQCRSIEGPEDFKR